jgi:hypothetical protein
MGTFDRSIIPEVTTEDLVAQQQENEALVGRKKSVDYLAFKSGLNIRRIMPPHPGTKTWIACKGVHWLPIQVVVKKDDKKEVRGAKPEEIELGLKNGTYIYEIKRKPIFNSRIHGGITKSLSEEYKKFAEKCFTEEYEGDPKSKQGKTDIAKKMMPITDWKEGINLGISWVAYCLDIVGEKRVFGRQEFSDGLKKSMDAFCISESGGQAIQTDVFSHIDKGKALGITYDPTNEDKKKIYIPVLYWQKDWPITDDELELWNSCASLEEMFKNCYKRRDFLQELEGLRRFDETKKLNFFAYSDFQKIIAEIAAYFPEEETTNSSNDVAPQQTSTTSPSTSAAPNNLDAISSGTFETALSNDKYDKAFLLKFIEVGKINVTPRESHNKERICSDIIDALLEANGNNKNKVTKLVEDLIEDTSAILIPAANQAPESVVNTNIVEEKQPEPTSPVSSTLADLQNKYAPQQSQQ